MPLNTFIIIDQITAAVYNQMSVMNFQRFRVMG